MATLLQSLPYKEWIIGVGLDSDELNNPPVKFAQVFRRAQAEGYLLPRNCIGERGFWCSNCATRSFIKVSFGLSFVMPLTAPGDAVVTDDEAVVGADDDGLLKTSPATLLTLICSQAPC